MNRLTKSELIDEVIRLSSIIEQDPDMRLEHRLRDVTDTMLTEIQTLKNELEERTKQVNESKELMRLLIDLYKKKNPIHRKH